MSAKIKVIRPTVARKKTGRPEGRTEIGATVNDVRTGYAAFCMKHGLPLPRKWQPRKAVELER